MALTQTKFKSVAAKLFAKAKAGNLTQLVTFATQGGTDPVTGATTAGASDTVDVVREDYQANEIDGSIVMQGDFKLLAEFDSFVNLDPRSSGITATVDGVDVRLMDAQKDAADAAWTLQMRKL